MMPKKFIVHISGPGCSGKSTLAQALGEKFPGTYLVAYDKLKWQLSGYDRNGTDHRRQREIINEIEWELVEQLCRKSIPIATDVFLHDEKESLRLQTVAEKYGYTLMFFELTAPREVLLERFRGRVKNVKERGTKVSLTDEGQYVERLSMKCFVPTDTPVFDTSVIDVKNIADKITDMLGSS